MLSIDESVTRLSSLNFCSVEGVGVLHGPKGSPIMVADAVSFFLLERAQTEIAGLLLTHTLFIQKKNHLHYGVSQVNVIICPSVFCSRHFEIQLHELWTFVPIKGVEERTIRNTVRK